MRAHHLALPILLFAGCKGSGTEDTDVDLPGDDTDVGDTGEPWEFQDTGGADTINDTPTDVLTLHEWGAFTMTPVGGPYTSLSGDFYVQEYLNGVRPDTADTAAEPVILECDLVYSVSGVPFTGTGCAGCDFAFRAEFDLVSGAMDGCHDPELPAHQQNWTVGWQPTDGEVLRDWGDSGMWMKWFDGTMASDVVTFEWEVDVGVSVEEMEP